MPIFSFQMYWIIAGPLITNCGTCLRASLPTKVILFVPVPSVFGGPDALYPVTTYFTGQSLRQVVQIRDLRIDGCNHRIILLNPVLSERRGTGLPAASDFNPTMCPGVVEAICSLCAAEIIVEIRNACSTNQLNFTSVSLLSVNV